MEIRFDLSNADVLQFLRVYDFAWARRQVIFDVEAVRAILLRAMSEGWSLRRTGREIEVATQFDGGLADQFAHTETIRAANAAAVASYKKGGVERLAWIGGGAGSCQYCRKLNRKETAIGKPFLEPGAFQARKNGRPLLVREAVSAPPLHWGCRCAVSAAIR